MSFASPRAEQSLASAPQKSLVYQSSLRTPDMSDCSIGEREMTPAQTYIASISPEPQTKQVLCRETPTSRRLYLPAQSDPSKPGQSEQRAQRNTEDIMLDHVGVSVAVSNPYGSFRERLLVGRGRVTEPPGLGMRSTYILMASSSNKYR